MSDNNQTDNQPSLPPSEEAQSKKGKLRGLMGKRGFLYGSLALNLFLAGWIAVGAASHHGRHYFSHGGWMHSEEQDGDRMRGEKSGYRWLFKGMFSRNLPVDDTARALVEKHGPVLRDQMRDMRGEARGFFKAVRNGEEDKARLQERLEDLRIQATETQDALYAAMNEAIAQIPPEDLQYYFNRRGRR